MAGLLNNEQDFGGLLGYYLSRQPGEVFARKYGVPERTPYPSEMSYFRSNPAVTGMAAEDNRVVMNPFPALTGQQRDAVRLNESARVYMRQNGAPQFALTPEQMRMLSGTTYANANENDRRSTIAARLLSGDMSAGMPTPEQSAYIELLRRQMGLR